MFCNMNSKILKLFQIGLTYVYYLNRFQTWRATLTSVTFHRDWMEHHSEALSGAILRFVIE